MSLTLTLTWKEKKEKNLTSERVRPLSARISRPSSTVEKHKPGLTPRSSTSMGMRPKTAGPIRGSVREEEPVGMIRARPSSARTVSGSKPSEAEKRVRERVMRT